MYRYLLAYGSNQGASEFILKKAVSDMDAVRVCLHQTSWIKTPPLPTPPEYHSHDIALDTHGDYVNFLEDVRSELSPCEIYQFIFNLENKAGHSRERRWAPRHLDIDLVLWAQDDGLQLQDCTMLRMSESLQIPHKAWPERGFWVSLASEIGLDASTGILE